MTVSSHQQSDLLTCPPNIVQYLPHRLVKPSTTNLDTSLAEMCRLCGQSDTINWLLHLPSAAPAANNHSKIPIQVPPAQIDSDAIWISILSFCSQISPAQLQHKIAHNNFCIVTIFQEAKSFTRIFTRLETIFFTMSISYELRNNTVTMHSTSNHNPVMPWTHAAIIRV